jgi:3-phenylpropionate/trans-cinnamate dioxygenase ferredoxin reductase subunit
MNEPVVVVGAGLAAAKAVESLRECGFDGPVLVLGEEPHRPYERPPLSKEYLMGKAELDSAFVHEAGWYDEHDVELLLGRRVTGLDVARQRVTAGDEEIGYSKLLLATGASPRTLPVVGAEAPVTYLRTMENSDRIRSALRPDARIVVVGGGWIGLEVAAAGREAGARVTVVETLELPLLPVLGAEVAQVFATLHRAHDVDLRVGTQVDAVERADDGRAAVGLDDGSVVEADLVVVGIGVRPNTQLAEAAGLEVADGVVVDERLATAAPDVLAAGDVASAYHPRLGRRIRVEHWDNAIGQGETAGRNLAGLAETYDRTPYFFTDQYDLGMEYVGHVGRDGYDEVVLCGDTAPGQAFTAFWLRDGSVLAGMQVNDWDVTDALRRVVGHKVDRAVLCDRDRLLGVDVGP